jgi:hypothetical protein
MSDIEKLAAEAIRKLGIAYPSAYTPEMVRLYADARRGAFDWVVETLNCFENRPNVLSGAYVAGTVTAYRTIRKCIARKITEELEGRE